MMGESDRVELNLEIVAPDATNEELDHATRQLLSELFRLTSIA